MERYNLLVTFHPNQAGTAEMEVRNRIEGAGYTIEHMEHSCVNGVFCIEVNGDAKELIKSIRREFMDAPEMLYHTFHWVPVDTWVEATEEAMIEAVKEAAEGIGDRESWKMHVHKRHHPKHSEDLMLVLTDPILKGKVDLRHPQKIIAVEVLGPMAGISLLENDQIIDVNQLRLEVGLTQII
jgi:tRNA(Ser,Leu) C12 N-acetylase TAN1